MKLTKEIIKKLPKLYSTENTKLEDKKVICKFFDPSSSWTWYVIEGNQVDNDFDFWGLVVNGYSEEEYGYFRFSELNNIRNRWGIGIERDIYFSPCKLSELKRGV